MFCSHIFTKICISIIHSFGNTPSKFSSSEDRLSMSTPSCIFWAYLCSCEVPCTGECAHFNVKIYQSCQSAFLTFASKSCWPLLWPRRTMWTTWNGNREWCNPVSHNCGNTFSDLTQKTKQWKLKRPPSGVNTATRFWQGGHLLHSLLPPASAVEVIELVPCFCVSFRLSVSSLALSRPNRLTYWYQSWYRDWPW